MEELLQRIQNANDLEIQQIMAAVRMRYMLQYPDWEVFYLAIPKDDPAERMKSLQYLRDHFHFEI